MFRPGGSARLLEPRHWALLALLGAASFFEGYDLNIVLVALPQLRETFGLTRSAASLWISLLYLGALPALFLGRRADRRGRRSVLLVTLTGYTIATAATAMSPSIAAFAGCQFVARLFLHAETAIVWTMVAEELPAGARGYGFGLLATLSALGTGTSALLYGVVFAPLDISWRWLYVAALPVLLVVAAFRRRLPESGRFDESAPRSWRSFPTTLRSRLYVIAGIAVLANLVSQATVFVVDFFQNDRGLSPSSSNLVLVAAGAVALPVLTWSGSLSDRFGRKPVGCAFLALSLVGGIALFFWAQGTVWLFVCLAIVYVGQFGSWPTLGAFGSEPFPTAVRAQSSTVVTAGKVVGQFLSFLLAAGLLATTGTLARTVLVLGIGPIVAIALVVALVPETSGRELEELALAGAAA